MIFEICRHVIHSTKTMWRGEWCVPSSLYIKTFKKTLTDLKNLETLKIFPTNVSFFSALGRISMYRMPD